MNKIISLLCLVVCGISMVQAQKFTQITITNNTGTTTFDTIEWYYGSVDMHNMKFDQIDDISIAPGATVNLVVPVDKKINNRMIEVGGFILTGLDSQFSGGGNVQTNLNKASFVVSKKNDKGINCFAPNDCQANLIIQ